MRFTTIFSILLLLSGCAAPPAKPVDAVEIMKGVLAYAIYSAVDRHIEKFCADPIVQGTGLDNHRDNLRHWTDVPEVRKMYPDELEDPRISYWIAPQAADDFRRRREVPASLQERLVDATRAILAVPGRQIGIQRLPSNIYPSTFVPVFAQDREKEGCDMFLRMTAPAVSGDFAFVDLGFGCGGLCGWGEIVALERKGLRWEVVAMTPTWIA